jgi:riboflavin synthase
MFTGIVEELGRVKRAGERLVVACGKVLRDSDEGASMAVNGVCLTVVERWLADESSNEGALSFDLSPETLARTALGRLTPGDPVNLERPVTLLARLGGHLVQGHVDGVGEVTEVIAEGSGKKVWISFPAGIGRYIVEKGSVAVDGVSLTVAAMDDRAFAVALVPYTLDVTTLGAVQRGDRVNLEADVVAKYLEGLIRTAAREKERSA